MQFEVRRETLLAGLQEVTPVTQRRQTMPVLSNLLLALEDDTLALTGTDTEVEISSRLRVDSAIENGAVTLPARKLTDICKALPPESLLRVSLDDNHAVLKAGGDRFSLSALPAGDFPAAQSPEEGAHSWSCSVSQGLLKTMLHMTGLAMADQDVRYYFNAMLLERTETDFRLVASDGSILGLCIKEEGSPPDGPKQLLVPRRGILELTRLLPESEEDCRISAGRNHIQVDMGKVTFQSKLVDGKFPDYRRVFPKTGANVLRANTGLLKQALNKAAILAHENYRGVRLTLSKDTLTIEAHNTVNESATVTVPVDYRGEAMDIGFNVNYLLNCLGVMDGDEVSLFLTDPNSGAIIKPATERNGGITFALMPMRL